MSEFAFFNHLTSVLNMCFAYYRNLCASFYQKDAYGFVLLLFLFPILLVVFNLLKRLLDL